jgi:hypothetical protein
MAYKPLDLDKDTPPHVRALIRSVEKMCFSDVHTMLRLPEETGSLDSNCDFAIAHVLMAVIGGVSATLYMPGIKNQDRAKFTGVLTHYYPWDREPCHITPQATAIAIYEEFRNPLTHDLGLDIDNKRKGAKLILKRLAFGKGGLPESFIETELEGYARRKNMSATLTLTKTGTRERKILLVEALYWGVRQMIQNISADKTRMAAAEKFLSSPGFTKSP